MKNIGNKKLIYWVVILIVLFICLISLVIYKEFFVDKNTINLNNKTTIINTTTTDKVEVLSGEELDKYLSYVPFSLLHDDAYERTSVNINNINKASLLYTVYHLKGLEKLYSNDNETCMYEGCILERDFNTKLEEMYNVKIDNFESQYSESEDWLNFETYLILKDGYYFELGYGGSKNRSDAKNVSYQIINNELIINEQVGIIVEHSGNVTVYDGNNSVKSYSFMEDNGIENSNYEQQAEDYVKENLSDFNTYKHTFKQHDDGTYYWYSTEVVEN